MSAEPPTHNRILHLVHGLTIGGAEIDLLNKSIFLTRTHGYEVTIVCLMRRGDLAAEADAAGIRVLGPFMRHRYDLPALLRVRRLLMSDSWSLIHSHLFASNLVGWIVNGSIPRRRRLPLVAAEHAMPERWSRLTLALDRLMQHGVERILVPSEAAATAYARHGIREERLQVLSNSIDIRRFLQIDRPAARDDIRRQLELPETVPLVGSICRLQAVKGLSLLIEAVKALPVQLIIAGEGPERPRLEAQIRQHGLEGRVKLLGTRNDVPALLAAMDLFVLPSYDESFGIAVAEALLVETPVVATGVGGVPEVTDGDNYGFIVPPGRVDALKAAIQRALDDPEEARRRAIGGRRFIQETRSVEAIGHRQHDFYQTLLASYCGGGGQHGE